MKLSKNKINLKIQFYSSQKQETMKIHFEALKRLNSRSNPRQKE